MTPVQQNILLCLLIRTQATGAEIRSDVKTSEATFKRALPDLYEDGLIEKSDQRQGQSNIYVLTEDGGVVARRLRNQRGDERQVAQPRTIDKFAGRYTPSQCYQRNFGNKHIQSRGYV